MVHAFIFCPLDLVRYSAPLKKNIQVLSIKGNNIRDALLYTHLLKSVNAEPDKNLNFER